MLVRKQRCAPVGEQKKVDELGRAVYTAELGFPSGTCAMNHGCGSTQFPSCLVTMVALVDCFNVSATSFVASSLSHELLYR